MNDRPIKEIRKEVVDALTKLEEESIEVKPEPYRRGQSPDSHKNNPKQFTSKHVGFLNELDRLHVHYVGERYVHVNKWSCRKCHQAFIPEADDGTIMSMKMFRGETVTCPNCGKESTFEQVQLIADTLVQIGEKTVSIEAEGKVHDGEDSTERDMLLKGQEILVFHAPNKMLKEWGWCLAQLVALVAD